MVRPEALNVPAAVLEGTIDETWVKTFSPIIVLIFQVIRMVLEITEI